MKKCSFKISIKQLIVIPSVIIILFFSIAGFVSIKQYSDNRRAVLIYERQAKLKDDINKYVNNYIASATNIVATNEIYLENENLH